MKLFRFFASALMLLGGVHCVNAEIIISADTETTVKVAEVASLTFDGDFDKGNLIVHFTDGTTSSTPISSIQKISFKAEENTQVGILQAKGQPTLAVKGNYAFITSDGGQAVVFDAQGRKVQSARLNNGTTTLSLDRLPVGNYILNINGHSVKFQKK